MIRTVRAAKLTAFSTVLGLSGARLGRGPLRPINAKFYSLAEQVFVSLEVDM